MMDEQRSDVRRDRVVTDVLGADVAITPSDLCNQQFRRTVFGGYHPDEVDIFLERVANDFEHLLTQMKGLTEKNEEQKGLLESLAAGDAGKTAVRWLLYRLVRDDLTQSLELLPYSAYLREQYE